MSRTALWVLFILAVAGLALAQSPAPAVHAATGSGTPGRVPVFVDTNTVQDSVIVQTLSGSVMVGQNLTIEPKGAVAGFSASFVGVAGGIIGEDQTTNDSNVSADGVIGITDNIAGSGVHGVARATTGSGAVGVLGRSGGDEGRGVFGIANSTTGVTFGVFGRSDSADGIGAAGRASDPNGGTVGVRGVVESPNGAAGQFLNNAGGTLIQGISNGNVVFSVDGAGAVHSGPGADLAEHIDAVEKLTAGDVVGIDPSHEGSFRKVSSPNSTLVAGVISSQPGVVLGGKAPADVRPLLALAGRVPVKVTAQAGEIRIGDLLISSSKPGYAMRCPDRASCAGGIIGKALQPMSSGEGTVLVLLSLQ